MTKAFKKVECRVINVHEERVNELEALIISIRKDLLMRAELAADLYENVNDQTDPTDVASGNQIVVNISSGIWERMRDVENVYLAKQKK